MRLPLRTTPHTRLAWRDLAGWLEAAMIIDKRPRTSLRKRQIAAHLYALHPVHAALCFDPQVLRHVRDQLTCGDFRQPPRGARPDAPQTALIVAISNRLFQLERKEAQQEGAPCPSSTSTSTAKCVSTTRI